MGSITIRNIDDEIKRGARLAAAANNRSLEAELRALLKRTYDPVIDDRVARIRAMSGPEFIRYSIEVAGGVGLDIPEREAENFDFPDL